jgi:predicted transcriptional regulator
VIKLNIQDHVLIILHYAKTTINKDIIYNKLPHISYLCVRAAISTLSQDGFIICDKKYNYKITEIGEAHFYLLLDNITKMQSEITNT